MEIFSFGTGLEIFCPPTRKKLTPINGALETQFDENNISISQSDVAAIVQVVFPTVKMDALLYSHQNLN
jgi:hypothetical protein